MPDPILDGGNTTAPEPRERTGPGCVCQFCGCKLTARGEIITVGTEGEYPAKKTRRLVEENEKLEGTVATLRQEIEDLRAKEPMSNTARARRKTLLG
jgi:hypothetical protein